MSGTKLEYIRATHEEIEECEKAIEQELSDRARSVKDLVIQEYTIKACMEKASEASKRALKFYEDNDKSFKKEVEDMSSDIFTSFYTKFNEIKNYHSKFPDTLYEKPEFIVEPPKILFSGEEFNGRYVDLNHTYELYINLPKIIKVDYITYLEQVRNLSNICRSTKLTNQYKTYLTAVYDYCKDYYHKIQPLVDLDDAQKTYDNEFEDAWEAKSLPDWFNLSVLLDWKKYPEMEDLNTLETKDIRDLLSSIGMKSGYYTTILYRGTKEQIVKRLWDSKNKTLETVNQQDMIGSKKNVPIIEVYKPIAALELYTLRYLSLLDDRIRATVKYMEKKQILSYEEILNEIAQAEQGDQNYVLEEDDDEERDNFSNPLNLPIGWDGKPIPYWLWKLHGLGVEFKCEICGNHSYWGRRAFDLHFQEWRHSLGMKCLGIPNTRHFHDITTIEDAELLYKNVKDQLKKEEFLADNEEEYEDTHGNVISKRMYDDLARQGLL